MLNDAAHSLLRSLAVHLAPATPFRRSDCYVYIVIVFPMRLLLTVLLLLLLRTYTFFPILVRTVYARRPPSPRFVPLRNFGYDLSARKCGFPRSRYPRRTGNARADVRVHHRWPGRSREPSPPRPYTDHTAMCTRKDDSGKHASRPAKNAAVRYCTLQ